eukprot:TRINITY_DN2668_c0_g1_i20.p3 TRINITY_DN2668_c0_g1~~TRINITY_DN2668_c0_g1_i20.p3  ORF type:complete len:138 (-),score=47.55 TRINITY_DN2668_c0_g1_i20:751-1164(-)
MCNKYLNASGNFIMKTYRGTVEDVLYPFLKSLFKDLMLVKAISEVKPGSRMEKLEQDKEMYIVGRGYFVNPNNYMRKIMRIKEEYSKATTEKKKEFNKKVEKEIERTTKLLKEKGIEGIGCVDGSCFEGAYSGGGDD